MQSRKYLQKEDLKKYFKNYRLSLRKILNNVFKQDIKRITYLGNCKMSKMSEYRFNLLKFNVVLKDYSNYSVFIRTMYTNQVEESLFCYWFFCQEYFSLNTKFYAPKANIVNFKDKNYEKRYELQLLNKCNKVCKSSFIDIIDLKKYSKININNKYKKIKKCLFIAII